MKLYYLSASEHCSCLTIFVLKVVSALVLHSQHGYAAKAHKPPLSTRQRRTNAYFIVRFFLAARLAARAASFSPWVRATSVACAHAWSSTRRWVRTRLAWRRNVPAVRQGLSSSARAKSWSLCRSPAGHRPPLELSEINNILQK